ncbi:MAG: AEC family transporter [Bradymonadaceae bacterium]
MFLAIESLIPIVLLVALGAALLKWGFITPEVRGGMDRFTYWIALPSLFVQQLAGTDFQELAAGGLILVLALGALAAAVVAAVVAFLLGLSRDRLGVFVQAGFRGNLAFVGLPLIIFALGGAGVEAGLVAASLVALAVLVPISNIMSVFTLLAPGQGISFRLMPRLGLQLAKNPLIISALLGGFLGWMAWRLPVIIDRPLELLGQTALALALVSLGGALIELDVRGHIKLAIGAGLLKIAAMPAITYGLCLALSLPDDQILVAMIFAACPTATASFIMTTQLGGDKGLAATCVVVSTVMSLGSLVVVLAWLG